MHVKYETEQYKNRSNTNKRRMGGGGSARVSPLFTKVVKSSCAVLV